MISIDRDLEWLPMMRKIMDKFKELEDKIDLIKSDTKFLIKESDKKKVR